MSENQQQKQYSMHWIVLLALFTSLGPLSIDMYLPALPEMADHFGVTTQRIANSLPAYFFGLAVGQLFYGPISDKIGRKKPLYFGMGLYAVASLLCVFAPNDLSLFAARVLQALGGCVGVVMARAAIRDKLDLNTSAQAFANMMIVMGLAPIIAPLLGAWVLHFFEWQAVFIVLSAIGTTLFLCVHFFFDETLPVERRLSLNIKQVILLYSSILQDRTFRLPMWAGCLTGAALFSYISSAASVFMDQFQIEREIFAYLFGFNALGIIILSSLNKRLAKKLSIHQRLTIGGIIQVSGSLLLFILGCMNEPIFVLMMIGLFMTVAGIGFTGPNSMALAMAQQGARAGTASAIMGSVQFAFGLFSGVILNFLIGTPLLKMGALMLIFTTAGFIAILKLNKMSKNQSA